MRRATVMILAAVTLAAPATVYAGFVGPPPYEPAWPAGAPTGEMVKSKMLDEFLDGPMAAVEEIVFAVRCANLFTHWYDTFGHYVQRDNGRADERYKERMDYGKPGGRLCALNLRTGKLRVLLDDPTGSVRDPVVHYDGRKVLFSYRRGESRYFNLCEMDLDGPTGRDALRWITDGPQDDIEPTYLPDGSIVFCSSRVNCFVPCNPSQVAVTYRCDADGSNVRRLSANVEHENTPWVLPDGRILYMRWEYVRRSQMQFHHLWTMNPDGTGQMVYFGNMNPGGVMIDAKPIPGSSRTVASFCPGHGSPEHAGWLTVVDPDAGPDDRDRARSVTKDRDWRDPWAFSEDYFLAARDAELCVMNGDGEHEVFFRLDEAMRNQGKAVHEPRPVIVRQRERVIPNRVDPASPTGTLVLGDINHGRNMKGVQPGEITNLLVLEILPKPVNHSGQPEPIGTFLLSRILGTVPIEPDGSACFEVPARRPVFFVPRDKNNRSVKTMHSFASVMPGETVGCVGCHEHRTDTPRSTVQPVATARPPSKIEPIADVPQVFDFVRHVQPILDRHCTRCHNWKEYAGETVLLADRTPWYSISYGTLRARGLVKREGRGNETPRTIGSSASPLMTLIDEGHEDVKLSPREKQSIALWIDSGAHFAGTYAALGTGMVNVPLDKEVLDRRCGACHEIPDRYHVQHFWKSLRFGGNHGEFTTVHNLTEPANSLLLLAPLAEQAGGLGLCTDKDAGGQRGQARAGVPVFTSREDEDYLKLLAGIAQAKEELESETRFDMPDFVPGTFYLRELRRYGILSNEPHEDSVIDPYALDAKYWRSFWHTPASGE